MVARKLPLFPASQIADLPARPSTLVAGCQPAAVFGAPCVNGEKPSAADGAFLGGVAYIWQDVEGFQEEWLQCRRSDQERNIRENRKRVEQAKKRLADLDVLLSRLYEDFVLGDLSKERYKKMTADYEAEQERLKLEIEVTEEWLETQETMSADVDAFVALTQKYVDVPELTPTIVNEYIKKIEVFAPDKSSGKRVQKVKIYFNFVDDVEIPVIS